MRTGARPRIKSGGMLRSKTLLVRHAARHLLTGLHAAAAAFGADTAMFMHAGVLLTLVGATAAGGGAHAEHPAHDFVVRARAAGRDAAHDVADVGAIQVQTDALGQFLHHAFGQAGVGARRAGLGAGVAFFDTADQGVIGLAASNGRVGADHLACVHGSSSSLGWQVAGGPAATTSRGMRKCSGRRAIVDLASSIGPALIQRNMTRHNGITLTKPAVS